MTPDTMKLLEWIEMLALIISIPFTLFVLLPFGLSWLIAQVIAL